MHPSPQLPRPLPVHDPDLQDAPLAALGQVFRHQIIDFPGLEQVQVERAGMGHSLGAGLCSSGALSKTLLLCIKAVLP